MSAPKDQTQALLQSAAQLHAAGRYAQSAEAFGRLSVLHPREPSHRMNLGTALRALGRHDDALRAYMEAAGLGASSPEFLYNVGLLHVDLGDYEAARNVLSQAHRRSPADAEITYQYAQCCYDSVRTDEALAALAGWRGWLGVTAELAAKLALLFLNLGEPRKAAEARDLALSAPSPDAATSLKLIQFDERTNRIDEARAGLEALEPRADASSLGSDLALVRAQLAQRTGNHEAAIALFEQLLRGTHEPHRRHFHLFPLAKSLDARKLHEEAYAALVAAHRSQFELLKLTTPVAASLREPPMAITQYGCDAVDVSRWRASDAPTREQSPVFIVAFPRSGTTLLELTLDAHPGLQSMDEQPFLQHAIDQLLAAGLDYPAKLGDADRAQLDEARAVYWRRARAKVELSPGQRLLDKNPLNLLRLPAIRRLFPNSPIVLAIRHPCDVILSCFMQHFRAPEFALLCKDPGTLAHGYRRAFDFWYAQAALLDPRVLEVRYETFVGDFEASVRRVASFLELPWDDAMLAPGLHARGKGFISTPSYSQVVQPITSQSVGRWQPYAAHFEAVLPQVAPYLARWGYEAQNSR